ncbi:MAG: acyltransferase [Planctomycetes bacterium]|nr:acyltransferase [Planctomycetota bacterium]
MRDLRAAAVQFESVPSDKDANLARMRSFVEQAAGRNVRLVVFPECCVTGYWHLRKRTREELVELAEPIPDGPTAQTVLGWSRLHGMTIGAGLLERDGDRIYNSFVVGMADGTIRTHRKLHAFVSPHLSCGDAHTVFDTPDGYRAAVLICYDNNLVENARICALAGAEVLLAPHQTGGCDSGSPCAMGLIDPKLWDARREDPESIERAFRGDKGRSWLMRWLPARAHDNGLFLVFANGVGRDDNEIRTGNAMILDCYGRILAETWKADDDMVVADLDASLRPRCTGVRWIRARRPELYQPLTERTGRERDTRSVRFDHLPPDNPPS